MATFSETDLLAISEVFGHPKDAFHFGARRVARN